jgi:hypothetical protein
MIKYRRPRNAAESEPWHFCRDCSDDPKSDYEIRYDQPAYGQLCYQCKTGKTGPPIPIAAAAARRRVDHGISALRHALTPSRDPVIGS